VPGWMAHDLQRLKRKDGSPAFCKNDHPFTYWGCHR
jgi:hypothetical protein